MSRKSLSRSLEKKLYQETGSRCAACGQTDVTTLTVHHIVPYALTKKNDPAALIVLCSNCHAKADRRVITEDYLFDLKRRLVQNAQQGKKRTEDSAVTSSGSIYVGQQTAQQIANISGPTTVKISSDPRPKVKPPRTGDAAPGQEITAEQAEELREWIIDLVEQWARRKKRGKPIPADYSREYGEFNAKYDLSSYNKLPASRFTDARAYLEKKFYSRRQGATKKQERWRLIGGIKAIQKKLSMTDEDYREHLRRLTGKDSTRDMSPEELRKVFRAFKTMQQESEAQAN